MRTHLAGDAMSGPELNSEAWKTLLDHAADYVFVIDKDLRVRWANKRAREVSDDGVIGVAVKTLAPRELQWTIELIREVLRTGNGRDVDDEFEIEGRLFALELTYLPLGPASPGGGVHYVGVCVRNVSEARRQSEYVERLERRTQHLVDNALDLVFVISHDLELVRMSANVEDLLGWKADQLEGIHAYTLLHPDDIVPAMQAVRAAMEHPGSSVSSRLRVRDPAGRVRTLSVRGRSIADRIIVHAREVEHDLGDIEFLKQSLSHADRLASIGRLTAGVAHEINNPTSFVLTNLFVEEEVIGELREHLSDAFAAAPRVAELFQELEAMTDANRRGLKRIQSIVRNLRSFARDEAPDTTEVDVNEAVEFALAIVEPRATVSVDLVRDLADEIPTVLSDRSQLVQIAVNLLTNALDAVQEIDDPRIVVRTGFDDESVWFEVVDNGPGVEEVADELFEPFFTTKPRDEGTGLGLWLCAEMLGRLGGSIKAIDQPAGGARFRVRVPHNPEPGI